MISVRKCKHCTYHVYIAHRNGLFVYSIGTMVLVENGSILWSLQVDHQLFSLAKLDVTVGGTCNLFKDLTVRLTHLHSEWWKLDWILVILSAKGLKTPWSLYLLKRRSDRFCNYTVIIQRFYFCKEYSVSNKYLLLTCFNPCLLN